MNKTMQAILQALSYGGIEVESARWIADLKKLDPLRIFVKKLDIEIYNNEYKVPVRCISLTRRQWNPEMKMFL